MMSRCPIADAITGVPCMEVQLLGALHRRCKALLRACLERWGPRVCCSHACTLG